MAGPGAGDHYAIALAVALALIPMALAPIGAVPRPEATVISVRDGDTIRMRMKEKPITVRLACINAPETAQQPYSQNARQCLQQRLSAGSAVTLAEKTTDRYGRLVAEVFNGINLNLVLVEDGQELLHQGHPYLDSHRDGEACESLRRSTAQASTSPLSMSPAGGQGSQLWRGRQRSGQRRPQAQPYHQGAVQRQPGGGQGLHGPVGPQARRYLRDQAGQQANQADSLGRGD